VWNDLNADGQQGPGEPGSAGVTVDLMAESGEIVGTTSTDSSGHYQFTGVIPWDGYQVNVHIPAGYRATMPHQGGPETDSTFGYDGTSDWFWPAEGSQELTIDAGLVQDGPGHVGDLVWNDLNSDGIREPGGPGMAAVEVRLLDTDYEVIATTQTDAQGGYGFDGLIAGKDYRLQVVFPTDYKLAHVELSTEPGQEPTFNADGFSRVVSVAGPAPD